MRLFDILRGQKMFCRNYSSVSYQTIFIQICVLLICGMALSADAQGLKGFGFNRSRIVVMGNVKGGAEVSVINNSDNVYLLQSRTFIADGVSGFPLIQSTERPPFIVTPPLSRMDKNSRQSLRILVTPNNNMPSDRESLFYLMAKAIPSNPEKPDSDKDGVRKPQLLLALEQYVKLYYRPASLNAHAILDGEVSEKLKFSLKNGRLHVSNPTPYYITFGLLKVNGKSVESSEMRKMISPKGQQDYLLPAGISGVNVEWQIINEFGSMTDKATQNIT